MTNSNTTIDESRLAKALREIIGSNLECEWTGPECLVFGAASTTVYDPDRNLVTLDLCANCIKDHNVA